MDSNCQAPRPCSLARILALEEHSRHPRSQHMTRCSNAPDQARRAWRDGLNRVQVMGT